MSDFNYHCFVAVMQQKQASSSGSVYRVACAVLSGNLSAQSVRQLIT